MNYANSFLDLSASPTGPDLLLKNAFRLAQMPVDATHGQLKKRQHMLEMADKMSIPVPDGPSAVFPLAGENLDGLREALHRLQDPLHRLVDELFWFWPRQFGQSADDESLALLAQNNVSRAVKLWTHGEKDTQNSVSTHNLALLHLIQATESELSALREQPSKSNTKAAGKLWKSAFQRWKLLTEQDAFWSYLKDRVRTINDPRLPLDLIDSLQNRIPHILFSINAGLLLAGAKAGDSAFIKHQRSMLNQSGFPIEIVDQVIQDLTTPHRDKLQHLCQAAKDQCKREPRHGDQHVLELTDHAEPLIRTLRHIYASDDRVLILVSDQVAETILHCQVKYGGKTENWAVSLELLEKARSFALGETAKSRIEDNIEQVRKIEESGNIWCLPGYFDLPEACLAVLEEAREHADGDRHDEAIKILRELLLGWREIPFDSNLHTHVHHCIAYCLKSKAIVEFNRTLAEFNAKVREALWSSFTEDNANRALRSYQMNQISGYGEVYCASCCDSIDGTFVVRTIQDLKVPFCENCSGKIDKKIETLRSSLKKVTQGCLDAMVLAEHYAPDFKPVTNNIEGFRSDAVEYGIKERSVPELITAWDLSTIEDRVAAVLNGSADKFQSLKKFLARQSSAWQSHTLSLLYNGLRLQPNKLGRILPIFTQDTFFIDHLIAQLRPGTTTFPPAERHRANIFILGLDDEGLRAHALESLKAELADTIPHLLQTCGTSCTEQQKALIELFTHATEHGAVNGNVDCRLLVNALFAAQSKRLSKTLLELNQRFNPKFDKLSREKASIRSLKYLEVHGQPAQREIARAILDLERGRGLWGRFNVWQWRPAKSFSLVVGGQTPWWAASAVAPMRKKDPSRKAIIPSETEDSSENSMSVEYSEIMKLRTEYGGASAERKKEIFQIFQENGWGAPN